MDTLHLNAKGQKGENNYQKKEEVLHFFAAVTLKCMTSSLDKIQQRYTKLMGWYVPQ